MAATKGSLSINSENIFPIIKKWLYSDHDIFFRELISNGCDAITKLKKLSLIGEYEFEDDEESELKVQVIANANDKTLTFIDNGIGMTAEEIDEYINQIAFMVADRVTIESLSYKEGSKAVKWECENGLEFSMDDCDKTDRGTKITLYLNDDSL